MPLPHEMQLETYKAKYAKDIKDCRTLLQTILNQLDEHEAKHQEDATTGRIDYGFVGDIGSIYDTLDEVSRRLPKALK